MFKILKFIDFIITSGVQLWVIDLSIKNPDAFSVLIKRFWTQVLFLKGSYDTEKNNIIVCFRCNIMCKHNLRFNAVFSTYRADFSDKHGVL